MLDQGIHLIDLILNLTSEIKEVHSFISNNYWKHNVEDNAYVMFKDKKGVVAMIHSTATQWEHKFSIEITCEKGMLILSGILSKLSSLFPTLKINGLSVEVTLSIIQAKSDVL